MKPYERNADKDGNVWCALCGEYLGNWKTCPPEEKPHYRAVKWCDECRPEMNNKIKKYSRQRNAKPRKLLVDDLYKQVGLVREENKELREIIEKLRQNHYAY